MPRILIGGRFFHDGLGGVASYTRAVARSLEGAGASPEILTDCRHRPSRLRRMLDLPMRHAAALIARPAIATPMAAPSSSAAPDMAMPHLGSPDLYRRAEVRFRRTGRPLTICLPGREGVMHWPYPVPLRAAGWTNVYTIHDLIPLLEPDLSPIAATALRARLLCVLHCADALITISQSSARDLVQMFGEDLPPLHNCGSATDDLDGTFPTDLNLDRQGYFLCIGSIDRRKNVLVLARAHARSGSRRPLVIAGWVADRDGRHLAAELSAMPGVRVLEALDRRSLMGLLGEARALLMPSKAEGFGLPVIEAFAKAVPVMASNIPALSEVAGDAALLVDPADVEALAAAIARLDGDDALVRELGNSARRRYDLYSPQKFAERLLAAYAEAARRSGESKVARRY